jgi:hypothetical protein
MAAPQLLSHSVRKLTAPAMGRRFPDLAGLFASWPDVVGQTWAARLTPLGWRGGRNAATLEVGVSPAEAILVQHELPVLLKRINGFFGHNLVTEVRLKQIDPVLTQSSRNPSRRRLSPAPEPIEGIEDPELEALLGRLGAAIRAAAQ